MVQRLQAAHALRPQHAKSRQPQHLRRKRAKHTSVPAALRSPGNLSEQQDARAMEGARALPGARERHTRKPGRGRGVRSREQGIDIAARLENWQRSGDERLWKLIISPEFGDQVELRRLTGDLMKRMEKDLGTELEWVAVEHHNTEHPHAHVAVRGARSDGAALRMSRDYIQQGIRSMAENLCTRQLGYRTEIDAAEAERREISESRFTSLDRRIMREASNPSADFGPGISQLFGIQLRPD